MMFNPELTSAVENFSNLFINTTDEALDRPWQWKGYDEGVRFAFFIVSRDLRELAVRLSSATPASPSVHQVLGQYHAAYLDLQAALYGISHEDANMAPSENDWAIRRVLAHIVGADIGFSMVIRYALEGHRAGTWSPDPIPDEAEMRLIGMSEQEYQTLMKGPYENLLAYHRGLHPRIIAEFAHISEVEIDQPAAFWEDERFPIRYRLHRFEAHLRQHTIQIDKTLTAIDLSPSEIKRLVRMLYAALADVDAALISADATSADMCRQSTASINALTQEIAQILQDPSPVN